MDATKELTYNLIDLNSQDIAIIEEALKRLVAQWQNELKPPNNVLLNNLNLANAMLDKIHTIAFC